MPIKKSDLYSTLWSSCDELRGGMDASQYKDYVLFMLFVKYISDKYAGVPYAPISIPEGASFQDMVQLKGNPNIGELINTKIVGPLEKENGLLGVPDFNDVNKLGDGKEMVERLTNLIAIFQNSALDFSKNRAENDDILGDAYEYLMNHFAKESGKSKGQFYTPSEVSRLMAQIIGIHRIQPDDKETYTVYDPTCGSGSLLLKISSATEAKVDLYGQEKDIATTGLAKMNMVLHNQPFAMVKQGNTLTKPRYLDEDGQLRKWNFVVANPPFSDKKWQNGLTVNKDPFKRFDGFGIPPAKNGDFAYLLHIIASMKRNAKATVILPHGVLFRGNAEAAIRENLIRRGLIKGIIGLPSNLFYGTGIPASIIVLDKEDSNKRQGIFMVNASEGFIKDGNKNRLRERDIHKISDVFNSQTEIKGFSRFVPMEEIEENEYNLNIPRYIENLDQEDRQDIEAHLRGGIPVQDIDALERYWSVFPSLRKELFSPLRANYEQAVISTDELQSFILENKEFHTFQEETQMVFTSWHEMSVALLQGFKQGDKAKHIGEHISNQILYLTAPVPLLDRYVMYQHVMDYWQATMQDDCYLISENGWVADAYRITVENKKKQKVDKGWDSELVPKQLVKNRYFQKEYEEIQQLQAKQEQLETELTELEEEQAGEDGHFSELEKINKTNVNKRLKELKKLDAADEDEQAEQTTLEQWVNIYNAIAKTKKELKADETALDNALYEFYPSLTEVQVKQLVIEDKWLQSMQNQFSDEVEHISQRLTNRVKELTERYAQSLPEIDKEVSIIENKVQQHLQEMGFTWN